MSPTTTQIVLPGGSERGSVTATLTDNETGLPVTSGVTYVWTWNGEGYTTGSSGGTLPTDHVAFTFSPSTSSVSNWSSTSDSGTIGGLYMEVGSCAATITGSGGQGASQSCQTSNAGILTASITNTVSPQIVGAPNSPMPSILPTNAPTPTYAWTMTPSSLNPIKSWTTYVDPVLGYCTKGYTTQLNAADLTQANPLFFWVASGSGAIALSVTSAGVTAHAPNASESVVAPTASASGVPDDIYVNNLFVGYSGTYVHCGEDSPSPDPGWAITGTQVSMPTNFSGTWQWIQLVEASSRSVKEPSKAWTRQGERLPCLDNNYPYASAINMDDSPGVDLNPFTPDKGISFYYDVTNSYDTDTFTDYLMFTPSGYGTSVIPVPIETISWSWYGDALGGPSSFVKGTYCQGPTAASGTAFNSISDLVGQYRTRNLAVR